MTYEEFAKKISEHPKGWRLGVLNKEIYIYRSELCH